MATMVDSRYANQSAPGVVSGQPMVSGPGQTVVSDIRGGWMSRLGRALLFGLFANIWVLGTFLPAIIMIGMNWPAIQNTCGDFARRALVTACVFIFHSFLVTPMFIRGDRAHAVTSGYGYGGYNTFWRTNLAHTAAILQAVGNLIELALLIWTAVGFWHDANSGSGSCSNSYPQFTSYMWAMLIIGFVTVAASLATLHKQYSSAALRFNHHYAKGNAPNLMNAP